MPSGLGTPLRNAYIYGMVQWQKHIHADPGVLVGKPTIRGTRLAVEFIVELLASGWTMEDVLENYPRLTREDLTAVFAFVASNIKDGLTIYFPSKSA